jgi:hypothetical protein
MGQRTADALGDRGLPRLPAPSGLRARPGRGQVTLDWEYVERAVGYLVHRAGSREGPFEPLDHLGRDVLAVPHPPYADTTCRAGEQWWYAVAAIADVRTVGELSDPVSAGPLAAAQPGPSSAAEHLDPGQVTEGAPPRNEIYQRAPLYSASEGCATPGGGAACDPGRRGRDPWAAAPAMAADDRLDARGLTARAQTGGPRRNPPLRRFAPHPAGQGASLWVRADVSPRLVAWSHWNCRRHEREPERGVSCSRSPMMPLARFVI